MTSAGRGSALGGHHGRGSDLDLGSVRRPPDAVTWLTGYLVLLVGVPSALVIGPLGGAGSPAQILGLLGLGWWVWHWLNQPLPVAAGPAPVRKALALFLVAVGVSYVAAMLRPIEQDEISVADLAVLSVLAWAGTFLVAHDGIPTWERLETLVRRLAIAGGVLALLGIVQFVTRRSWVDLISIPGLSANHIVGSTFGRDEFTRPSGTASHPIEFGMVVTMLLPFALHWGFWGRTRSRLVRWVPALAIALVLPLSLSRSSLIGAALCLAVLIPTWPRVQRRAALAAILGVGTVMFVSVPGILGTLTGLFTGIGGDSSALSRTGSYAIAAEFIRRAPVFGRGLGTFLPRYRILDNQLLLLTIEVGVVGLAALLWLLFCAMRNVVRYRQSSDDPARRALAQSLLATLVAATVMLALFDTFSFPMAAGMLFLVLGIAGATGRFAGARAAPSQGGARPKG